MRCSLLGRSAACAMALVVGAAVGVGSAVGGVVGPYLNETNVPGEADYAVLQFPPTLTVQFGQSTGNIYGRLYEAGVTETAGQPFGVLGQLGYGPSGTDPLVNDSQWFWIPAAYNVQVGNDDEWVQSFLAPAMATVLYTYRFSLDGGSTWTLGDLDGAGSNQGLTYSAAQLGVLHVTDLPSPGMGGLVVVGVVCVGRRRRG